MALMTATGPKASFLPSAMGGDAQLEPLVQAASFFGLKVADNGDGTAKIENLTDLGLITYQVAQLLVSKGGDLEGWPAYAEMSETRHNSLVPVTLKEAYFINEDGTQGARKKWSEWHTGGTKYGTKWYQKLNPSGRWLDASDVVTLDASTGITIKSEDEMKVIIGANA